MIRKGGRLRPSPAMVVACVALFVALAGTAFSVGSKVPGKNGVKSSDIAPKAVKTGDLGDGAVTSAKLGDGAVTNGKLAADAVTGEKVAPNALSGGDINYGSQIVRQLNLEGASGVTVTCPAGQIATGGGTDSFDAADTGALLTTTPLPSIGQPATAWQAFYQSPANAGEIAAYAICMPE